MSATLNNFDRGESPFCICCEEQHCDEKFYTQDGEGPYCEGCRPEGDE